MSAGILTILLWGLALVGGTAPGREAAGREAEDHAAAEAVPEGLFGSGFSSDLFGFKPSVRDDGKDDAAGWQKASARLNFSDGRQDPTQTWQCPVTIGMPLRTEKYGKISPEWATSKSAKIATDASKTVMHSQSQWVSAAFCIAWRDEMLRLFAKGNDTRYLGARVSAK